VNQGSDKKLNLTFVFFGDFSLKYLSKMSMAFQIL